MALKRQRGLTRDEVREALDTHQISISKCAKGAGVPRSYLSEFLSIGRPLTPKQLSSIKEFLEGEGVEFDDAGASADDPAPAEQSSVAVANVCHFPIRADAEDRARKVVELMARNDARIIELLGTTIQRPSSWSLWDSDGEWSEETEDSIRELFGLATLNYFLFRALTSDSNPLKKQSADEDTIRARIVKEDRKTLEQAGIDTEPDPEPEAEADQEAA